MKKYIISILIFVLLMGVAYWFYQAKPDVVQLVKNNGIVEIFKGSVSKEDGVTSQDSVDENGVSQDNTANNQNNNNLIPGRDVTGEGLDEEDASISKQTVVEIVNPNDVIEEVPEPESKFSHSGELGDVSGGQSIGIARAVFTGETYDLLAEFSDLPQPEEGFFYEGWVVRQQPLNVVSTGRVGSNDVGVYKNIFSSDINFIDHSFYVLTLEPDDGDPAPAEHILEGIMSKL